MNERRERRTYNALLKPPPRPSPDPYAPGSPDYAARNKVHAVATPDGLTIVTLGAPLR